MKVTVTVRGSDKTARLTCVQGVDTVETKVRMGNWYYLIEASVMARYGMTAFDPEEPEELVFAIDNVHPFYVSGAWCGGFERLAGALERHKIQDLIKNHGATLANELVASVVLKSSRRAAHHERNIKKLEAELESKKAARDFCARVATAVGQYQLR